MRRSIATVCLGGNLREKLEAAAAARYDGVEIFENDLLYFGGTPKDVRQLAADLGLTIDLYQPFRDFETSNGEMARRNLDRARRKFDVMAELGAPMMLVCSSVAATAPEHGQTAEQLAQLAELAATRGIRIGYEALAWGRKVSRYGDAWSIVGQVDHPHLGIILDSFHTLALDDDLAGLAAIPGDKIFYLQLADAPLLKMDVLSWSRHFRSFPGQGALPVAQFAAEVLRRGYTGPLSLEVFSDDFRASPTRPTAVDGMRSLLWLEEQIRRILDAPVATGKTTGAEKPRRAAGLFDPPPPPVIDRVKFIEFAVDDAAAKQLATWLQSLGFTRVGTHRSKKVTFLRQGDVNLVLNADPQGFAHSYNLLHGTTVCAVGLGVDDPQSAVARGEAFKAMRGASQVHPHETFVPSIRLPDGPLIYFMESGKGLAIAFKTDFDLDAVAAADVGPAGAGLNTIDHVAYALPEGQLDSWVLFLRATFGMIPDDAVVLHDLYGLVRSRALATQDRTVRFPLNTSEARNTSTSRSVSTFAGAGVHHIALATDDIFECVDKLKAAGAELLQIPPNYYDDLPARFELDPDFVDRLQAAGVLYDQDDNGAFLNAYTPPFEDRFFFEIVQRVERYEGYGAANAAVRMAALSHWRARNRPAGMPRA